MGEKEKAIICKNLKKSFLEGQAKLEVLKNINLEVYQGEFISVCGPSGCGKTTLLNIIGTLLRPTEGMVIVNHINLFEKQKDSVLADIRASMIGFVFQFQNLISVLTALENVELPRFLLEKDGTKVREKAKSLLKMVGLENRLHHTPSDLSGGERQRVAIARALVNDPDIVLADEVTGNLDVQSSQEIMNLLKKINRERLSTILFVTHNKELAEQTDRTINLIDGQIQ